MNFPSLEHLDFMNDGTPWRNPSRRRRKFRSGVGGLRPRRGEATGDDMDDDIELDRVPDVEPVPDTSRKPARASSSVSRTASAAARQRERQLRVNRDAQPPPEPENRIYRPQRPQPLPPPPLAPTLPAPVDRDALRVTEEHNTSAEGEATDSAASKPRRQRRRRPRGEGETVPEASAEPQVSAAVNDREPRVHQTTNGSRNVSRDTSSEVAVKPEPEMSRTGRRHSSRRSAYTRGARRTDASFETFV